jgi:LPXTG-motif cell wall-anchored protein
VERASLGLGADPRVALRPVFGPSGEVGSSVAHDRAEANREGVGSRTLLMARFRPLLAVAALLALLLGPVGTASAHDVLVGTGPEDGATVPHAPASVSLEFGQAPQALGTEVVVTGPDGAVVSQGEPRLDGATATQPLAGELAAGAYTVEWRATSGDGHPISGSFAFTATEGAAAAEAPVSPSTGSSVPVVWLAVGVIGAIGAGLLVRQRRRPA